MTFLSRIPRLVWRERELAVARLAATLTHTLGTPLQVIAGRAALARKSSSPEELERHLDIVQRKCSEITTVLWRVLESLRVEQPRTLGPVDLAPLLETLIEELNEIGSARGAVWELRLLSSPAELAGLRLCEEDLRHALGALALTVQAEARDGRPLSLTAEKTEQEGRGLTPVHDAMVRFTFDRTGEVQGDEEADPAAPGTTSAQFVSDPWLHADGARVDGRALGWAATYELARSNEGRLDVNSGAVTLCWPIVL